MTQSSSPLRALAANPLLRREAAALALYRLAEFGPWVAMLVFAYAQGGATATGLVSLALLVPTALFAPFAGQLIDRFGASRVLSARSWHRLSPWAPRPHLCSPMGRRRARTFSLR